MLQGHVLSPQIAARCATVRALQALKQRALDGPGNREETLVAGRHTLQGRRVVADDMAAVLAYMVGEPPVNGVIELAGPESLPIAEFVGRCLAARGTRERWWPTRRPRREGAKGGSRQYAAASCVNSSKWVHSSSFDGGAVVQ